MQIVARSSCEKLDATLSTADNPTMQSVADIVCGPVDIRLMAAIHRAKKLRTLQFKLARARDHLGTYYQLIDELTPDTEQAFRDLPYFRARVALWQGYIAQFKREITDLLAVARERNRHYSR